MSKTTGITLFLSAINHVSVDYGYKKRIYRKTVNPLHYYLISLLAQKVTSLLSIIDLKTNIQ